MSGIAFSQAPTVGVPGPEEIQPGLWSAVERIVESKLEQTDRLCAHGLGPLAADLLERRGRPVPLALLQHQRAAVRLATLMAPAVIARVRRR